MSLATKALVSTLFRSLFSGFGWFDNVTPAGLGRKDDYAGFRLFDPDRLAAGFDRDGKPGAQTARQSRERMNLRRFDTAVPPLQIDFKPAARAIP
jgi:hypothetical protein